MIYIPAKKSESKQKANARPVPEVNVGMVGHVDHGKTSLTQTLTGKWTDTHSEEIKRGITIRLGYADATFYRCGNHGYTTAEKCIKCFSDCEPARTVSFVDAPGHETLMTTMLAGASIMDGALLVVAANERCPQPQTREHLQALDIVGIRNIVVVQNKIDLVTKEQAMENYRQIKAFLKGSVAESAPIIPVSSMHGINIDALIETIEGVIPTPKRETSKPPKMMIARSFDVNKPGTLIEELKGGVLGGSLVEGELKMGDKVEILPGIKVKDKYQPVKSTVAGLQKAFQDLGKAGPGGLLGVSTGLDPYITKSDTMVGNILGLEGKLPPVWEELELKTTIFHRVVGSKEEVDVGDIKPGDMLMLTVGIARTIGTVASSSKGSMNLTLKLPICASNGDKVAISRQVSGRWRLIGWGTIA